MDNNVTMNHRNSHVFITLLLVFMTSLFFVDWHGGCYAYRWWSDSSTNWVRVG